MTDGKIKFNNSPGYTVGIEVETQLIDRESLALTPTSTKIISGLDAYKGSIKHELMLSNLEINTDVCSTIAEAERDLLERFRVAAQAASKYDTLLSCAGTHPFSHWRDQEISEDKRYRRLGERLQIIARRFNIFGLHVHVGVNGGERCIYVLNRMLYYIPHLLALSVNSPFWDGYQTGLRSYRSKIFESLPIGGLPFYFKHWEDYTTLLNNYLATGTVETLRDVWWDVRPHPDFGTVEVRICDTPSTIGETLAIAALIQAMVKRFSEEFDRKVPVIRSHAAVIRENKWRACRYGLDGDFVTAEGNRTIGGRAAIEELLRYVEEDAEALGSSDYIASINDIIEGGDGASRQFATWERSGDLRDVVHETSARLYREIDSGEEGP
ncbi:MAG: YbdK family carboxylate-amine ligase [Thermodesulfobacteriota bacterium]